MQIRDRVRIKSMPVMNKNVIVGDTGRIIAYTHNIVGVEIDRNIEGHSCDGVGKQGHCTWISKKHLEKID